MSLFSEVQLVLYDLIWAAGRIYVVLSMTALLLIWDERRSVQRNRRCQVNLQFLDGHPFVAVVADWLPGGHLNVLVDCASSL